jgi:hypothetical protein
MTALTSETIVGVDTEGAAVSFGMIADAVQHVREWLDLKLTTGACANGLVYQLAGHWCRMPQSFGATPLLVDFHAVADQIGALEKAPMVRAAKTKAATQFDTGPLEGLWHKHWFQASFMVRNLLQETEKNGVTLIMRKLNRQYGAKGWEGKLVDNEVVGLLAHAMVEDALEYRTGTAAPGSKSRLTGEWIVFAKARGRNIYLTLGGHNETNNAILNRCAGALRGFPELAEMEPFRSREQRKPDAVEAARHSDLDNLRASDIDTSIGFTSHRPIGSRTYSNSTAEIPLLREPGQ